MYSRITDHFIVSWSWWSVKMVRKWFSCEFDHLYYCQFCSYLDGIYLFWFCIKYWTNPANFIYLSCIVPEIFDTKVCRSGDSSTAPRNNAFTPITVKWPKEHEGIEIIIWNFLCVHYIAITTFLPNFIKIRVGRA